MKVKIGIRMEWNQEKWERDWGLLNFTAYLPYALFQPVHLENMPWMTMSEWRSNLRDISHNIEDSSGQRGHFGLVTFWMKALIQVRKHVIPNMHIAQTILWILENDKLTLKFLQYLRFLCHYWTLNSMICQTSFIFWNARTSLGWYYEACRLTVESLYHPTPPCWPIPPPAAVERRP